jgi:outer membrane protein OmpA-like peptidoglycan-associated protein
MPRHRVAAIAALALAAIAALAGCATALPPGATPRAASPVAQEASLEVEQRRLAARYRGSPVVAVLDDDGALWVEVPAGYAFDPGKTDPRPALGALLTEVAASVRRVPGARLRISAPSDEGASPVQADRRASQVRAKLVRLGVPTVDITTVPTRRAGWLMLQMEAAAVRPPAGGRPAP